LPGFEIESGPVPRSVESGRPLTDFAVLALTLSFEMDYFNIGDLLRRAGRRRWRPTAMSATRW
jgi:hypothetical protein